MRQYLALLYDTPESLQQWMRMSPEEIQQGIEQYAKWSDSLAARGHLVGGEKLQDGTGRVLRAPRGTPTITDGPFTEAAEVIGGYFLISAADYEEAVRLLSDCPHLEHGTVELREIEPLNQPAEEVSQPV
jgi:hypothetical protein